MPTTYAIIKGNQYMDATTFTSTGTTQTVTNAGGFKPDLIWSKSRTTTDGNDLNDSVRGASKYLVSFSTAAEATDANFITSFNSNGFSIGTSNYSNGQNIVAWQWQAGQGNTVVNSTGTITANVSTSTTAGFSIAKWTSTSTGAATIGHGLGVAPACILIKLSSASGNFWTMYHQSLGNTTRVCINNSDPASAGNSGFWNNTSPTTSVFSVGSDSNTNGNSYVGYIWAAVPGFSAFGSYVGNGSTDGPFIYTGFNPALVIVKNTSVTGNWLIFDNKRPGYDPIGGNLYPNLNIAEDTGAVIDFLSNGFKMRRASNANDNQNGNTYVYAAFASTPFKYSNSF